MDGHRLRPSLIFFPSINESCILHENPGIAICRIDYQLDKIAAMLLYMQVREV